MMDPKTFDLVAVLAGRNYPETTATVYFDEAAGLEIANRDKELQRLSNLGKADEYTALEEVQNAAIEALKDQAFTFTIRGVSRKVKSDVVKQVMAEHPSERNAFGVAEPNPAADERITELIWQTHIVGVTSPTGETTGQPDEDTVKQLLGLLPQSAYLAIEKAINEVTEGAKSGFEIAARDADFLSGASPKA